MCHVGVGILGLSLNAAHQTEGEQALLGHLLAIFLGQVVRPDALTGN